MHFMKRIVLACIAVCLYIHSPAISRDSTAPGTHPGWVFPEKEWIKRSPRSLEINTDTLAAVGALIKKAHANAVLIRNGYLVAEWNYDGPGDMKLEVQSITKSITSMLLGVALKEGKIADIHDRVKDYYPDFSVGPYTNEISFWHLVTNTSGIKARHYAYNYFDPDNSPPGIASQYHNDHIGELSSALAYIFGDPLIKVLQTQVLSVIGGEAGWGTDDVIVHFADGRQINRNPGYAFSKWSARDLARVGWLYANKGRWKGTQLISPGYVDSSWTPLKVPVLQFSRPPKSMSDTLVDKTYGYGWRAIYADSGELIWYMSGNGGQFCAVVPSKGIVLAKINGYSKAYQPYVGIEPFKNLILSLVK